MKKQTPKCNYLPFWIAEQTTAAVIDCNHTIFFSLKATLHFVDSFQFAFPAARPIIIAIARATRSCIQFCIKRAAKYSVCQHDR